MARKKTRQSNNDRKLQHDSARTAALPGCTLKRSVVGFRSYCAAWSPDGKKIATGSIDDISVWSVTSGKRLKRHTIDGEGHVEATVIAWSRDGRSLVVGDSAGDLSLWEDADSGGTSDYTIRSDRSGIVRVSWSPQDTTLVTCSEGGTLRRYDLHERDVLSTAPRGMSLQNLSDVKLGVDVSWFPDGTSVLVALANGEIWQWADNLTRLHGRQVANGLSVAIAPEQTRYATGTLDGTIHIRSLTAPESPLTLEGHTGAVYSLAFSFDGRFLASHSEDDTVRVWDCTTGAELTLFEEIAWRTATAVSFSPTSMLLGILVGERLDELDFNEAEDTDEALAMRVWELNPAALTQPTSRTVHYLKAKVVLVGNTGVGKTCLGAVLNGADFAPAESTHGRTVWSFDRQDVEHPDGRREFRETLLWDLAGQAGYRVFHQLHLNDAAVALLLFDARDDINPFAGVAYWSRAIDQATASFPLAKILVASRIDRGGILASNQRIQDVVSRYAFLRYVQTSARRNDGIDDLRRLIRNSIPWDKLPRVTAPELFHDIKQFLLARKESGEVIVRHEQLVRAFRVATNKNELSRKAFDICLIQLEAAGLLKCLKFGGWVLLQPEMLDDYCSWAAQAARQEPDGLGFISERDFVAGEVPMDRDRPLSDRPAEERLLLLATVQELVGRAVALREDTDKGTMLVFPSELRTDMPEFPGEYVPVLQIVFEGPIPAIYATLAVRLINSLTFSKNSLYKNAALFTGPRNQTCGFVVSFPDPFNDALGCLTVFFGAVVEKDVKLLFLRYVTQQIDKLAFEGSVVRNRVYQCATCKYLVPQDAVERRRSRGEVNVICPDCGVFTPIDDLVEETLAADARVKEIDRTADNEQSRQQRLAILGERESRSEFHVFLCHNSVDKPAVRQLRDKLRAHGVLAWLDEDGILAGQQFVPRIEQIIDVVPTVAVIIGPSSVGPWQQQEYYAFLQRYVGARNKREEAAPIRIIPVLLPGVSRRPVLPVFLRGFSWVDFREKGGLDDLGQLSDLVAAILRADPR